MISTSLVEQQKAIEEESLGLGMKRYREALVERGEDNLPPGLKLMKAAIAPLAAAIDLAVDEGLSGKASRGVSVVQLCIPPKLDTQSTANWTVK